MALPLDPHPMVLKTDGSRHRREYDCGVYCRFAPREGYAAELAVYPITIELLDAEEPHELPLAEGAAYAETPKDAGSSLGKAT